MNRNSRWHLIAWVTIAAAAAAAVVGTRYWWQSHPAAPATVAVPGGDGGGWPRATPASEGFDEPALQRVADYARSTGAQALLVTRHAHLVIEQYGTGIDAQSRVDGGAFAELLVALAAGVAVRDYGMPEPQGALLPDALAAQIASASRLVYPRFLSRNLWQPLNAAAAQITLPTPGAAASAACCLVARASDWLRVAQLLLADGRFEGAQILPTGWAQRLQRPIDGDATRAFGVWLATAAEGAEPYIASEVVFLRGPGQTRLWAAPQQGIAIVLIDPRNAPGRVDETRLPNMILRALRAGPAGAHTGLGELVPNHGGMPR